MAWFPGSDAGKTQELPKSEMPSLRLWVTPTSRLVPENLTILRFRFVPHFAGVCRILWCPKGKKRATCRKQRLTSAPARVPKHARLPCWCVYRRSDGLEII
jgi:hypothetical protein